MDVESSVRSRVYEVILAYSSGNMLLDILNLAMLVHNYGVGTRRYAEILQHAPKVGYAKSLREYLELIERWNPVCN